MSRFTYFSLKHEFIIVAIIKLALFVVNASFVSSPERLQNKNGTETIDFCSMCEQNVSSKCFPNGLYSWIAQIPNNVPSEYQNYISILPPSNKKVGCKIEIKDHYQNTEDILILKVDSTNGNGNNNIWSYTNTSQNLTTISSKQFMQFEISRKIDVQGKFDSC